MSPVIRARTITLLAVLGSGAKLLGNNWLTPTPFGGCQ